MCIKIIFCLVVLLVMTDFLLIDCACLLLALVQQIELTQEFGIWLRQWRIDHKTSVDRLWVGPFDPVVTVTHPRHLKKLLNGK